MSKLDESLSEADFQKQIIHYARLRGWRIFHARPAMDRKGRWATHQTGDPGYPDLTLARRGVVLFREIKRQKGRATTAQLEWLKETDGEIWRPSDWETIRLVLQ